MSRLIKSFVIFTLLISNQAYSNDEPIEFTDKVLEQRYQSLLEETRCLVCQNQSLADSNAGLAQDLRKEIYNMLTSGKTDETIKQFLIERYGDFVLYRPPLKENTWLLWFGPFVFLIIALFFAIMFIKKQSRSENNDSDISEEQKQRLAQILKDNDNGDKE
jgi:cytochrome c-type biogenesis protein CcmH